MRASADAKCIASISISDALANLDMTVTRTRGNVSVKLTSGSAIRMYVEIAVAFQVNSRKHRDRELQDGLFSKT